MKVEVAVHSECLLGEGPVWDGKQQIICWVDILKGQIHQFTETKEHQVISVDRMVGAIGLCRDHRFIAALKDGFGFVDRNTGKVSLITDPEKNFPNNRFNDGKIDPVGRFWAGTLSLNEEKGAGNLYTLDANLRVEKKINNVTISNGLAWTRDQKTLYYIDTPTSTIVSYNYDKQTGAISEKKVVIHIANDQGFPDGMTIDSDDMLWIAHWDGWQIARYNPKTGEQLVRIKLPVARGTSCTFGGKKLSDLYITSARKELSPEQLEQQPLAGSLFIVKDCGYTGMPAFEFGG